MFVLKVKGLFVYETESAVGTLALLLMMGIVWVNEFVEIRFSNTNA